MTVGSPASRVQRSGPPRGQALDLEEWSVATDNAGLGQTLRGLKSLGAQGLPGLHPVQWGNHTGCRISASFLSWASRFCARRQFGPWSLSLWWMPQKFMGLGALSHAPSCISICLS